MQYMITGVDGKEYGPVDAATLRTWINQGRAMSNTAVRDIATNQTMPASAVPGLFPPVAAHVPLTATATPKKKSPVLMGCGGLLGFCVLMGLCNDAKKAASDSVESASSNISSSPIRVKPATTPQPSDKSKPVALQEPPMIAGMRKTLQPGGWGPLPGSEDSLQACVISAAMYLSSPKLVSEARRMKLTDTQRRTVDRYKAAAIERQIAGLPRLRARFAKLLGEKFWENDVEVRTTGSGNRTVEFVASMFAANRNIKEFMDASQENLKGMRFSQARFRWYKGADEFTYYDLKTPRDRDFVSWENGVYTKVK